MELIDFHKSKIEESNNIYQSQYIENPTRRNQMENWRIKKKPNVEKIADISEKSYSIARKETP